MIELTESKSKIIFKELPEDDPVRRRPDISKATALLEWTPKISLRDGFLNVCLRRLLSKAGIILSLLQ